ncbi:MAG TPA: 4Fe-4S dicluster domain-containing protein, partial [Deltaproteobacteria bacterium]|nr:4Fe-4S dicluster domain-containing protein [Deltaproteobacteria bacterium]
MKRDHEHGISRRAFLSGVATAAVSGAVGLPAKARAAGEGAFGTLVDLSLCDGCEGRDMPACVEACRTKNAGVVPEPVDPIPKPFPRGKIEDWSKKQGVTDRLTPYNYLFIQKAEVELGGAKKTVFIPRRCMHCDNPACATICPFSANHKYESGAVVIDQDICFGGAKCKEVCPWAIPERQSGVGIYLHILPTLAGNGVMFKCDLCQDLLLKGEDPVCITACPRKAMLIGPKEQILAEAERRAEAMNGYIYGKEENGGTSTLYVSPVPFELLDAAIEKGPGRPHLGKAPRKMAKTDPVAKAVMASPVIGLVAGLAAVAGARMKSGK